MKIQTVGVAVRLAHLERAWKLGAPATYFLCAFLLFGCSSVSKEGVIEPLVCN